MDTNIGNTIHLKAFTYDKTAGVRQIITPDSLTLTLYNPANQTVYTDNKPIPFQVPDPNDSTKNVTGYLFTLPGQSFTISTQREAPYLAQISATYASAPIQNSIPINVA